MNVAPSSGGKHILVMKFYGQTNYTASASCPLSSSKTEQGVTPSDQTASKSPSTLNDKIKGQNAEARERKAEIWHWSREMGINEGIPQVLYLKKRKKALKIAVYP